MSLDRAILVVLSSFCFLVKSANATEEPDFIQADLTDRVAGLKAIIAQSVPSDKERIESVRVRILDSPDIMQVYASREEGVDYITLSKGFAVMLFQLVMAMRTLPAETALSYLNYMVQEDLENGKRFESGEQLKKVQNPLEWGGWSSQEKKAVESGTPKGNEIVQQFTGALAFVLAHELGHHMLGHGASAPKDLAESRQRESDADSWACGAIIRGAHAGPLVGIYALLYYAALDNYALQHEMLRSHPAELKRIDHLIDATIEGLDNETISLTGSITKETIKANLESMRSSLKTAIAKKMPLIANQKENVAPVSTDPENTEFCRVLKKIVTSSTNDFEDLKEESLPDRDGDHYWKSNLGIPGAKSPKIIQYESVDGQYVWYCYILSADNSDVQRVFAASKQSIKACLRQWDYKESAGAAQIFTASKEQKATVKLRLDSIALTLTVTKINKD
jgi:hypothetical protein